MRIDDMALQRLAGEAFVTAEPSKDQTQSNDNTVRAPALLGETALKLSAEVECWDKLYQIMNRLGRVTSEAELVVGVARSLPGLVGYDRMSIALVDEGLAEKVIANHPPDVVVQRVFYLRRWFQLLSLDARTCSKPQFQSFDQLKAGRKTYLRQHYDKIEVGTDSCSAEWPAGRPTSCCLGFSWNGLRRAICTRGSTPGSHRWTMDWWRCCWAS